MFDCVGIVGVGLIGASVGLALKSKGLCLRVLGVGRNPTTLQIAQQCGAIDQFTIGMTSELRSVELLVLCAPVHRIVELAAQAWPFLPPTALVTDAGSTKATIVRQIEKTLPAPPIFVGSHPLAGSEKAGAAHGSASLFAGRWCVVTPTAQSPADAVAKIQRLWEALGMKVVLKSPEEHDRILGRTSHLPHLAAAALALTVAENDRPFVATGFRDTTRIAAGDPELWTAIFEHNRHAVLDALHDYLRQLLSFQSALETNDLATLEQLLGNAKQVRDTLGNHHNG